MKIEHYTHIGKKENNEDYLGFNDHCLVVCDGVGGAVKGERASASVVKTILDSYAFEASNKGHVEQVVLAAQNRLNNDTLKDTRLQGMATTLASVFLSDNGLFVAHAGDSRVYLVKPKLERFWQTWDHSLVMTLVKDGEITREQARTHPMNNQITKAFIGNLEGNTVVPEIHLISDLEPGDICFICSDGILESFSDVELLKVLCDNAFDLERKLKIISEKCLVGSVDNNSAILAEFERRDVDSFSKYHSHWTDTATLHEK